MLYKFYVWLRNKIWGPPKQKMLTNLFGEFMSVGPDGPFTERMVEQLNSPRELPPKDMQEYVRLHDQYYDAIPKSFKLKQGEGMAFIDSLRK